MKTLHCISWCNGDKWRRKLNDFFLNEFIYSTATGIKCTTGGCNKLQK